MSPICFRHSSLVGSVLTGPAESGFSKPPHTFVDFTHGVHSPSADDGGAERRDRRLSAIRTPRVPRSVRSGPERSCTLDTVWLAK